MTVSGKDLFTQALITLGDTITIVQAFSSDAPEEEKLADATKLVLGGLQIAGLFMNEPDKIAVLETEIPIILQAGYNIVRAFGTTNIVPEQPDFH